MAKEKRDRRKWSDEEKIAIVVRIKAGATVAGEARALKASPTLIRRWKDDPRYQPGAVSSAASSKAKSGNGHGGKRNGAGRPNGATSKRKPTTRRSVNMADHDVTLSLVATGWECPHCTGGIEIGSAPVPAPRVEENGNHTQAIITSHSCPHCEGSIVIPA